MQSPSVNDNQRDWPAWTCPVHGQELTARAGFLACPEDDNFPIVEDIPRFVPQSSYADHFGLQWKRYRLTQLDSYTGKPITRDRLRRCLGETLWNNLSGKHVLECGCGAGRFTEILLGQGARVTSIDLSSAVESNAESFPAGPAHRIAQADILKLPFPSQSFDVVLCLGVVQHTPSPKATIAALYRHLAPGGSLVIDHYTYTLGWYTKTAPLFRAWLKRLSPRKAVAVTEWLVDVFLPLHKRFSATPFVRSILLRISPVLSYYSTYPELDDKLQREWALLDTHDTLTDWYKHFRTRGQIRTYLEELSMSNVVTAYAGNGVEARANRPDRGPKTSADAAAQH